MISEIYSQAVKTKTSRRAREGDEWVHTISPTDDDVSVLVEKYSVDPDIVADIKDIFEVPRSEFEDGTGYFFTRFLYDVPDIDIDTAPILFVLGKHYLLTISSHETPFLERRMRSTEYENTSKSRLFLDCMSDLVASYENKLTKIRKHVYKDMGRVRSIRGREIQRLVFLEQEINEIISTVTPTHTWLLQLKKGEYARVFSDDMDMLEDVLIATSQLADSAKSILKTIQNVRSATEAILTQNLNSTIRMLTAFTIILTIPTLIASLFGMNVPVPLAGTSWGFWYILLGIFALMGGTIYFFIKNRWI